MTISASAGGVPAATNSARPISFRRSAGIFGIVLPPSMSDPKLSYSSFREGTGLLRRLCGSAREFSLSAPGGGEGRGEVGDSRAPADTHLTLPRRGVGPSLSALKGGEGNSR